MRKMIIAAAMLCGCAVPTPSEPDGGGIEIMEPDMDGAYVHVFVDCDEGREVKVYAYDKNSDVVFMGVEQCPWDTTNVRVEIDVPGDYALHRPVPEASPPYESCDLHVTEAQVEDQLEIESCF